MHLGRNCPQLPAELLLPPEEWRSVCFLLIKPIPQQLQNLNSVIQIIATLGGFLEHKGDGESGVETLWIGMQR